MLASKRNGTLYIGVTSDIARRAWNIDHMLSADLFAIMECID
jgi:predicted GIY-YIG superfamily endonuclease